MKILFKSQYLASILDDLNAISRSIILLVFLLNIIGCTSTKYPTLFDAEYAEQNDGAKELLLSQMPTPPKGFKWIMFQGVSLLKPISWSEYKTDKVYTYSIESVAEKRKFETGL